MYVFPRHCVRRFEYRYVLSANGIEIYTLCPLRRRIGRIGRIDLYKLALTLERTVLMAGTRRIVLLAGTRRTVLLAGTRVREWAGKDHDTGEVDWAPERRYAYMLPVQR